MPRIEPGHENWTQCGHWKMLPLLPLWKVWWRETGWCEKNPFHFSPFLPGSSMIFEVLAGFLVEFQPFFSHIWKILVSFLVSLGVVSIASRISLFHAAISQANSEPPLKRVRTAGGLIASVFGGGQPVAFSASHTKLSGWWFQIFFIFTPLTNIFQMGWNHQLETSSAFFQLSSSLTLVFFLRPEGTVRVRHILFRHPQLPAARPANPSTIRRVQNGLRNTLSGARWIPWRAGRARPKMCLGQKERVGINNNQQPTTNNNSHKKKKKKKTKLNPVDVNEISHEIGMTMALQR